MKVGKKTSFGEADQRKAEMERFFMSFQYMLCNRVGLKRKIGSFLRNYETVYTMSLRRIFWWWQVI